MELFLIIALVFLLYIRTLDYKYVIDDNVRRQGYMYDIPLQAPAPEFFNTKPTKVYRLFLIAMHATNVAIVYFIWGFAPALIFAVHPVCVWGTAWVTGNYYATTAFFTLIAFYIMHIFPNVWGAIAAIPFYVSALNSTVCAINFPFVLALTGNPIGGAIMALPLVRYLTGKKFKTGMNTRTGFVSGKKMSDKRPFNISRLILMTKVVGRYTFTSIYPDRLGLFGGWGNEILDNPDKFKQLHTADRDFWKALALIAGVATVGCFFSWQGTVWFFAIIALHSQFNLMGQFYAERYLYLAVIGLCVVAGTVLAPYPMLLAIVVTIMVVRTHFFIPVFTNMETIWQSDMDTYPSFGEVYSNMAQYHLNRKPIPAWRVNQIAAWLFKALEMEPNSWKIHMNVACFFAVTQQWGECLKFTNSTIKILEGVGGPVTPVNVLYKQREDIQKIVDTIAQEQLNLTKGSANVSPKSERRNT